MESKRKLISLTLITIVLQSTGLAPTVPAQGSG